MSDVGRPTVMTEAVLAKLEEAFSVGATDKEAYFLAGISKDAFYDYCNAHPEFSERKERLKDMPKYRARKNIVEALEKGDKQISQWYMERKVKEEFSPRVEQTGAEGSPLIPEDSQKVKEAATLLNEIHRSRSFSSDGDPSSVVGN